MLYSLKVLNPDATLNNFSDIGSARVYKGSDQVLMLQLFQTDRKIRFIPSNTAVITVDFLKSDNTTFTKTATFPFADDRSIFQINLLDTETPNLTTQNLIAKIVDGADISYAILQGGLQMVSLVAAGC